MIMIHTLSEIHCITKIVKDNPKLTNLNIYTDYLRIKLLVVNNIWK